MPTPPARRRLSPTQFTYIGADPGSASGGVAADMPGGTLTAAIGNMTERELWDWFRPFDPRKTFAVIEQVQAFGRQAARASFSFGRSYGQIRMVLIGRGIPFAEVRPQVWQKMLGVKARGKKSKLEHKDVIRAMSQQVFPDLPVWRESLGEQRAVSDALQLTRYARLLHNGNSHELTRPHSNGVRPRTTRRTA